MRPLHWSKLPVSLLDGSVWASVATEPVTMNHAHTNFGFPGVSQAVDQWHVDVVDYVFVVILSDITDMQGGELQVLSKNVF